MKLFALSIATAMLSIASSGLVLADHSSGCVTAGNAVAVGPFYVIPGPYVYQESNGMPGAQRGGENSEIGGLLLGGDTFSSCLHPDTIVL